MLDHERDGGGDRPILDYRGSSPGEAPEAGGVPGLVWLLLCAPGAVCWFLFLSDGMGLIRFITHSVQSAFWWAYIGAMICAMVTFLLLAVSRGNGRFQWQLVVNLIINIPGFIYGTCAFVSIL